MRVATYMGPAQMHAVRFPELTEPDSDGVLAGRPAFATAIALCLPAFVYRNALNSE